MASPAGFAPFFQCQAIATCVPANFHDAPFVRHGMHLTDRYSPVKQSSLRPVMHMQARLSHCACRSLALPECCCRTWDWRLSCALIVLPAQATCWTCAANLWTSPPAGEQAGACRVCCTILRTMAGRLALFAACVWTCMCAHHSLSLEGCRCAALGHVTCSCKHAAIACKAVCPYCMQSKALSLSIWSPVILWLASPGQRQYSHPAGVEEQHMACHITGTHSQRLNLYGRRLPRLRWRRLAKATALGRTRRTSVMPLTSLSRSCRNAGMQGAAICSARSSSEVDLPNPSLLSEPEPLPAPTLNCSGCNFPTNAWRVSNQNSSFRTDGKLAFSHCIELTWYFPAAEICMS